MKKIIALLLAVAVIVSAFAFSGCGEQNKETLKIGITYFEPMNYLDENGELTGFETDFAKAVCDKIGMNAEFQEIEWETKEIELNSKNIDCIWNGMTITDERKENMNISTAYMENKQVMVCKAENAAKYAKSADGAKVIAEAGSAGEEVAKGEKFFKGTSYTAADSQAKALLEVKSGQSDIAVIDYVMTIGTLKDGSDYGDLTVVEGQDFAPEQYGIAFRKGDDDLTNKVNDAIQELANEGKLNEIATKYNLQDLILVKAK